MLLVTFGIRLVFDAQLENSYRRILFELYVTSLLEIIQGYSPSRGKSKGPKQQACKQQDCAVLACIFLTCVAFSYSLRGLD